MTTHSSILAWGIPWAEELGRLQTMGSQRVGHTEQTHSTQPDARHTEGATQLQAGSPQNTGEPREGQGKDKRPCPFWQR